MLKKICITALLLTCGVNAEDLFESFQKMSAKMAGSSNLNSNETTSTESSTPVPQFNSLTEEAAYKKQLQKQQELKELNDARKREELIKLRIKILRADRIRYYAKYFVKESDTPEMIDNKFKNKTQLSVEMQKDFELLENQGKYLASLLNDDEKYHNISQYYGLKHKEFSGGAFPETLHYDQPDAKDYILGYGYANLAQWIKSEEEYTKYLKYAFADYEERAKRMQEKKEQEAQQAQAQKEQQLKVQKEQQERQKVKAACQLWRAKASKMTYSLGNGDQIFCNKGAVYTIAGVNANTFTVLNPFWNQYVYKQKNECIPYQALRSAPSPYCYK